MPHFDSSVLSVEKPTGVRCLSTNTDCLPNKIDEIEHFLKDEKIDIAILAETIPKNCTLPEIKNLNFNLSGYTCVSKPEGRGICIYINDKFEIIERFHDYESLFSPCIFCKIKTTDNNTFILGAIYRSPNSSDEENDNLLKLFDLVSSKFQASGQRVLIVGDFNCPDIDWSNENCSKPNDNFQYKFLNIIHQQYNITQFIDKPTHHRALQNPTLIDLLFSNFPDFVFNIDFYPPFGKSHHSVICFEIDMEPLAMVCKQSTKPKFCMDKGDYAGMRDHLSKVEWDNLLKEEESVDTWWDIIADKINSGKEIFIPKKN